MLSTEKATNGNALIHKSYDGDTLRYWIFNDKEDKTVWIPQHLYIITTDDIKDGDWFCNNTGKVFQRKGANWKNKGYSRIVSSTDKSITPNSWIPVSFINAYIAAHNNEAPITEVMLSLFMKGVTEQWLIPQTRPDGSVIIQQARMYSAEEVREIIAKAQSLAGSHYNWAPQGFREVTMDEFGRRFYMYILKPQCSKQIHRDAEGNQLKESFTSIRFWEIDYDGWENMGLAMASDNKNILRYFMFGEKIRWTKNENAFAAQFAGDNS